MRQFVVWTLFAVCFWNNECEGRIQYDIALDQIAERPAVKLFNEIQQIENPRTDLYVFSCVRCHDGSFETRNQFGRRLESLLPGPDLTDPADIYPILEHAMREYVLEKRPNAADDAAFLSPFFPELPAYYAPLSWTLILLGMASALNMFRELLKHNPNKLWVGMSATCSLVTVLLAVGLLSIDRYPIL